MVAWFASGAPLGISVEGKSVGASVGGSSSLNRVWEACSASLVPRKITIRECLSFFVFSLLWWLRLAEKKPCSCCFKQKQGRRLGEVCVGKETPRVWIAWRTAAGLYSTEGEGDAPRWRKRRARGILAGHRFIDFSFVFHRFVKRCNVA